MFIYHGSGDSVNNNYNNWLSTGVGAAEEEDYAALLDPRKFLRALVRNS
jgi:hypothetical protein